jgi:hypothetical protein
MANRYPLVLNGSQIQELQIGDSLSGSAEGADSLKVNLVYREASVSAIPNTIPCRDASSDIFANVFAGVASSAKFADLAEKYVADTVYEPGTVVVFGGQEEITVTDRLADTRVAGVISEYPAYIMNSESPGQPVALRGKVPVKVVGAVSKGDLLVTSEVQGVAIVASGEYHPSAVFAKSLAEKTSNDLGTVMAVIL